MDGVFRKPGKKNFYLRFRRHGRQHKLSLGTADEAEAVRKAQQILHAPELEQPGGALAELEYYFSSQRKADNLSEESIYGRTYALRKFFASTQLPVRGVRQSDVQKWYTGMHDVAEGTRQLYLRWLKAFYKFLIAHNRARENPAIGVKTGRIRPAARRGFLSATQAEKLISTCKNPSLKFALYCGLHAGMRKGEISEARPSWFHIDGAAPHISIGPTDTWIPKDREAREVPLTKAFAAFLATFDMSGKYMIAPDKEKGKWRYRCDFQTAFAGHIKAQGISCTFHDTRRTFASLRISAGVPLYKVAKWLGDGHAVVERHYGHLQPDNGDIERGL